MQKPSNLNEFIELINSMQHRERFVFPAKASFLKKYDLESGSIEIYNTILFNSRNHDRNITVYMVDFEGNPVNKKARLHRLWNEEFFKMVYVMLSDNEQDSKQETKLIELETN